jgi:hypothetical protein
MARSRTSGSETGTDTSAREASNKTCDSCGAVFTCGALGGSCWCDSVKVGTAVLMGLRARFGDCLCSACLKAAAGAEDIS